MSQQEICQVVSNGIRWSSNIVTELIGAYGAKVPEDVETGIRDAVRALSRTMEAARTWELNLRKGNCSQ